MRCLSLRVRPAEAVRLLLLCLVLWVFWPMTNHGFINFDDPDYITENRRVRSGLSLKNIAWAFTTFHAGNWHPLTWISHMADATLFGLNPGGHHLTGLLLHGANTLLLFAFFRKMTGDLWPCAAVAALFAFHPLHVESVAWASERKDLLSTLFWMLTLTAYGGYVHRPSAGRYGIVIILFAMGLMSKPMLVTLPFVMLLLDFWPISRLHRVAPETAGNPVPSPYGIPIIRRLAAEKIPLFLLSAASCTITFLAQQQAEAVGPLSVYTLWHRVGNALVSYVGYLVKAVWPLRLGVYYPHPGILPWWQVTGALLLLVSATCLILTHWKKKPFLLVGWLWYLGTLVPVIGLVQVGAQAMADRYTYIPLIGIFIVVAWGAGDVTARLSFKKAINGTIAAAVFLLLVPITRAQLALWHDSARLYEHTLAITRNNTVVLNNLGLVAAQGGRSGEAIRLFTRILQLDAADEEAHTNLGNVLMSLGRYGEAVGHYRQAVRANPGSGTGYVNLGLAVDRMGQTGQAIEYFKRAISVDPDCDQAHNALGNVMVRLGQVNEALEHYRAAARTDPFNGEYPYNLGVALEKLGRRPEAAEAYRNSLAVSPRLASAHINLGNILFIRDKTWEAAEHYHQAIEIEPENWETRYNMGAALQKLGRLEAAAGFYSDALRLHSGAEGAHRIHINLGGILMETGHARAAEAHYREALRMIPENSPLRRRVEKMLNRVENHKYQ